MTTVRFEPAGVEIEVAAGRRIVDVTDEHPEAQVPYSCRSANCGTCRAQVKQGMEAFQKAEEEELGVLDIFGDGSDVRLCCQLKLVNGSVARVVLRVVEP